MHQPTTQPRPSLYYPYQVFQPWLPSQHPAQTRQKVVIAGSGPAEAPSSSPHHTRMPFSNQNRCGDGLGPAGDMV